MFELLVFLLFIIICLYLPGKFYINRLKLKLKSPDDIFYSIAFGLVGFLSLAYLFSWMKLEILLLPVFLIIDYFSITKGVWMINKLDKKQQIPFLAVLFLSLVFSVSMLTTGKFGENIIYRHDDLWHLALINELKAHFPPQNPGAAGTVLKNYHFFYDFVIAKVSDIFFISPISLHFHLFPVLISLLWGFGVYCVTLRWRKSQAVSLWAVFLTMFGGSFSYILVFQGHSLSLDNGLGIAQAALSLYNPSFALSIIFLLFALFSLREFLVIREKKWLVPLSVALGFMAMVKVYAAIIFLCGFFALTILELLRKRYILLIVWLPVAALFFATYWLFAGNAGHLIYYPLWGPRRLLQSFAWYGYDEKIYTYAKQNVIKGILETESYGLTLFIFGNLGTRLIGLAVSLAVFLKRWVLPSLFSATILFMTAISFFVPLLFIQSGRVFEIIQMMWYFLFFSSLFAATGLAFLFTLKYPKSIKIILFFIIILATLPSAYENFKGYYQAFAAVQNINSPYFQTMHFLSGVGTYNSTVLEIPPQNIQPTDKSITDWYEKATPALSAFANKRSFFTNQFQDLPKNILQSRIQIVKNILTFINTPATSSAYAKVKAAFINEVSKNNIHLIYSSYEVQKFKSIGNMKIIYQNGSHTVYKIRGY